MNRNIKYQAYISPLVLLIGDDPDEFDYPNYLIKVMKNKETLNAFMRDMMIKEQCKNDKLNK